jgi:hypothetical protein
MAATKPPFHGDDRNRHTPNELCAWLSAPSHSHAVIAAIHDGDNAAGLQILAPGVVFQPSVAQNWATGSQGRVEDQASSWSVISLLMNNQMALLPLIVQQQKLFQSVLAVIFILE